MLDGDIHQERVQALRSVDKSIPPNAVPPATPDEIYHVDTHSDPESQREVVLWDDIIQAFKHAERVRHKTKVVSFLKGKDFKILEPHRIAAVPNTVLDVIVASPVMNSGVASPSGQQLGSLPEPPQDNETMAELDSVSQTAIEASNATSSTVRRNPAYGHEEAAMDNYSHMDMPLKVQSALRSQVSDNQASTGKSLPSTPGPNSSNNRQGRGPQSVPSSVDPAKDLAQLGIRASQGDKNAQVTLGDIYRDGRGVPQDYQAAVDWYLKAAEQGDPVGQHRLGDLYQYGQGVELDYEKALDWYLMAGNSGNVRSQREIADFYYNGRGVTKDYSKAMVWYRKAADQGDAGSQCKVGSLFEYGGGVRQDFVKAAEWYQKAADQNHLFAKKCLRALKENGHFA